MFSGVHLPWTGSPAVITPNLLAVTPGSISLEQKRLTHFLQIDNTRTIGYCLCGEIEICFVTRLKLGHKLLILKTKTQKGGHRLCFAENKREKCLISLDGSS